jgi:hypothetical protein
VEIPAGVQCAHGHERGGEGLERGCHYKGKQQQKFKNARIFHGFSF